MVRGNQQVSVHEVREEQQIHEDARKVHRTEIIAKCFWEVVKASYWRS